MSTFECDALSQLTNVCLQSGLLVFLVYAIVAYTAYKCNIKALTAAIAAAMGDKSLVLRFNRCNNRMQVASMYILSMICTFMSMILKEAQVV